MRLESDMLGKENNQCYYRGARLVGYFNGRQYYPKDILEVLLRYEKLIFNNGYGEVIEIEKRECFPREWSAFVKSKLNKNKARYLNKHKVKRTC